MGVDPTKVQFASPAFVIDKIAQYSDLTDSYPLGVANNLSYSIPGSGNITPTYTLETVPNTYGFKLLTTMSWSLDGSDYYNQGTTLSYYNATHAEPLTQMQVFCGCDASNIYFFFASEYTSTQTVYINYAADSIT